MLALREKDDAKALAMLQVMAKEFITEMKKLEPDYVKWDEGHSGEDRVELLEQTKTIKWPLLLQENPAVGGKNARWIQERGEVVRRKHKKAP